MADVVATFELVTVFGDAQSAERARALVRQTGSVRIGPWQVPIAEPTFVNAVEVTVWPLGLGYSGACTDERLNCPAVLNLDLDDVADQLSDLLRRFDGYLTAMVGWDPGTDVDSATSRKRWPTPTTCCDRRPASSWPTIWCAGGT